YADNLACRGPDTKAPITDVARIDLALLAFAARYPRLRELKEAAERKRQETNRLFQQASDRLLEESGRAAGDWKRVWGSQAMRELRSRYQEECGIRELARLPQPSDAEVVEMAREIVRTSRLFREVSDRLFKENGQKPGDWKKTWESQIRPDLQRWYREEGAR